MHGLPPRDISLANICRKSSSSHSNFWFTWISQYKTKIASVANISCCMSASWLSVRLETCTYSCCYRYICIKNFRYTYSQIYRLEINKCIQLDYLDLPLFKDTIWRRNKVLPRIILKKCFWILYRFYGFWIHVLPSATCKLLRHVAVCCSWTDARWLCAGFLRGHNKTRLFLSFDFVLFIWDILSTSSWWDGCVCSIGCRFFE